MKIDFCGGTYKTFSDIVNAEECINFIPIIEKGISVLRGTPGLKEWKNTGKFAEVRGEKEMGEYLYSIVGDAVFQISKTKVKTQCTGDALATTSGKVSLDENGSQLMIVDGVKGYIVEGSTISIITDSSFPENPTTVTHQDGWFITTHLNTGRCYISDLRNGTSWNSTRYFNAESKPDNSLSVISNHGELLVFGAKTMEPWYNSGKTVPFDQTPGAEQEIGIGAKDSPVTLDNTCFYLNENLEFAKLEGINPLVISPPNITHLISQYSKTDDAIGMAITIESYPLYVCAFPTANETWAYNVRFDEFFRLASYPEPYNNRWRGNCAAKFDRKWIIGDYENGKLYELDFNTFTDNEQTIQRKRISPAIFDEDDRSISFHELQILFEPGTGLATGQGSDPQAMLRWLDNGKEWSNEHWESVNKIGEYRDRAIWHMMGSSRHRNYELTVTDPIKWVVRGSRLRASIG